MQARDEPVNDLNTIVPLMILSVFDWAALVVLALGGLNWGSVGILNLDVVGAILGMGSGWARAVYVVFGVAAVYTIALMWRLAGNRP